MPCAAADHTGGLGTGLNLEVWKKNTQANSWRSPLSCLFCYSTLISACLRTCDCFLDVSRDPGHITASGLQMESVLWRWDLQDQHPRRLFPGVPLQWDRGCMCREYPSLLLCQKLCLKWRWSRKLHSSPTEHQWCPGVQNWFSLVMETACRIVADSHKILCWVGITLMNSCVITSFSMSLSFSPLFLPSSSFLSLEGGKAEKSDWWALGLQRFLAPESI